MSAAVEVPFTSMILDCNETGQSIKNWKHMGGQVSEVRESLT